MQTPETGPGGACIYCFHPPDDHGSTECIGCNRQEQRCYHYSKMPPHSRRRSHRRYFRGAGLGRRMGLLGWLMLIAGLCAIGVSSWYVLGPSSEPIARETQQVTSSSSPDTGQESVPVQAPTPVLYSPTESQTPISELVVQDERRQTFPLELVWQANALTEREMARLREFAIELINADRAKSGLAPVEPGTNQAAQHHAEDMLAGDYLGHWWLDGRKPYMVYSSSGGSSYASENVASSGWTWVEWQELDCEESTCKRPDVRAAIEKLQWNMMHDDAHADWGHRDNILGMSHRRVNIGIASNEIRVTFVQHFEGGDLEATGRPSIEGGILSLSVRNNLQGGLLHAAIGLYEDPPPQARTAAEIDALGAYCTGGGFTENCDSIAAAIRILKPPPPDEYYIDLGVNEIVADVWDEDDGYLEVVADIGRLLSESGVYTVVVWGVGEQGVSGDMLLELTVDR